MAQRAINHSA